MTVFLCSFVWQLYYITQNITLSIEFLIFLKKRATDFSVAPKIIYSIFRSLIGKFCVLLRSVYLHRRNGKTPKSQPSIFVNLRCCVRLCISARQGRCPKSRYKHLLFFRVSDYQSIQNRSVSFAIFTKIYSSIIFSHSLRGRL